MNSTNTLQMLLKNEREKFASMLSTFVLIDIGTIESVKDGRARVISSTFIGNQPVVYDDAEVIYPGNNNGCYVAECSGSACLIFVPRSCMPDSKSQVLRLGATEYNRDGVKALPIGNGVNNAVRAYFGSEGLYNILGQEYFVQFTEESVIFQRNDGATELTVDGTGQIYLLRRSDKGTYRINLEDDGITKVFLSQNKDVQWTDAINPDGSRSFVQLKTSDEDHPIFSMSIDAAGKLTVHTSADVAFDTTGDTSVTVEGGDASVTVKKKGEDGGNASVSAEGNVDITGDVIKLNGDSKRLVTYAELKATMDKLWIAMTTTPIAGNGSPQPSWSGITSIDISASETSTIKTGG